MYVVIMAGGVGTRFWPMSRKNHPKQLLSFTGTRSMLQQTYERVKPLTSNNKILVITSLDLKAEVENQLPEIPRDNIIGEPEGKNTAPCIGVAATVIKEKSSDSQVMVVLPADHLISKIENFRKTLQVGANYARENDCLITLGIQPTYPETGYGYIQVDQLLYARYRKQIFRVKTFAEKPNLDTAQRFLQSGDFLWNSGMFIWSVKSILHELEEHLPELGEDLKYLAKFIRKKSFQKRLNEVYARTKSISIDYGVMEAAKKVCVIKSNFVWNDLGSWEAVYNISKKDKNGNVARSRDKVLINSRENYLFSPKKVIAAIDVEGLVVVDMEDAILICKKDKSQDVKRVVDTLKRKKLKAFL